MSFRLVSLLWMVALYASALAAMGTGGIAAGTAVTLFWAYVFFGPRNISLQNWTLVVVALVIFVFLLLPTVQVARNISQDRTCANNLKQLVLAIHNYADRNGQFPSARTKVNGVSALGWRTAAVPYLGCSFPFRNIEPDEPWDGPTNRSLFSGAACEYFQCPTHQIYNTVQTSYFAVVDPRTVWDPDKHCTFNDIRDGTPGTIMLIEAHDRNVHWAEPKDISFEEALDLLCTEPDERAVTGHTVYHGFFYKPSFAVNVAFADGHVQSLPLPMARKDVTSLLTKAGGELTPVEALQRPLKLNLDFRRIYTCCAFFVLSLLPVMRLKRLRVRSSMAEDSGSANPGDVSHRG